MGKKREQRLREEIEDLRAYVARQSKRDTEARRKTDEGLAAALKSMRTEPFLIVTKSGHVIKGRANTTNVHQPTRKFSFDGRQIDVIDGGPREYSANITIEPITNSEV